MKFSNISVAALLAASGVSPVMAGESFTITGMIPGVTDSIRVALYNVERENPEKLADAFTTDGRFALSGSVKMPSLCELKVATRNANGEFRTLVSPRIMAENSDMQVSFRLPVDSMKETYTVERNMTVDGSGAHAQFVEYLRECGDAERKAQLAGYESAMKWFESSNDRDTVAKYDALKKQAEQALQSSNNAFIASHPDYHISSVLVFKELMKTYVYTDEELRAMAQAVKVCPDTARVNLTARALDWSCKYCLGMVYPDFDVNNGKGEAKRLSDFVSPGKYTFIDFWASWCGPCRQAIPHVRKLREQYGDRMNVYSISCDEDEAAWSKALIEEKMEWTQLHLTPDQMSKVVNLYCLNSIPRLLLLDTEGHIVCSTFSPDVVDQYLSKNLK